MNVMSVGSVPVYSGYRSSVGSMTRCLPSSVALAA